MITQRTRVYLMGMLVIAMLLSVHNSYASGLAGNRIGHGPGGGGGGGRLTQAEIDGLMHMREEEKLARDSYLTLYEKWHLPIFSNIASSEETHMTRIKDLLDRYGLPDPAAGNPAGVFTDPDLQQLYNDLMSQGSQSSTEALKVGVTIEEVDIQDLGYYLALTNKTDITQVYTNLRNASYNHLSAFNSQLGR